MASLAEIVKTRRQALNMTQEDLAERIGVDRSYIGHVESRRMRFPSEDILRALSVALDVPMDELAAAAYEAPRVHPPRPDRTPADIARELLTALRRSQESLPIMVYPLENQRISAGPGAPMDSSPFPYYPREGERGHRFVWVKVSGTCMEPRIHEGDIVVVDQDASPQHGNIVAALHDGEALVKMLEKRNGDTFLVALRKQKPLKVNGETRILGVVTFVGNWV